MNALKKLLDIATSRYMKPIWVILLGYLTLAGIAALVFVITWAANNEYLSVIFDIIIASLLAYLIGKVVLVVWEALRD